MAKMNVEDVLDKKYLTDTSLAQQLVAGTLSLDDQIIKDHVHQVGAYQEIYGPGPEPTMVDITVEHEEGDPETVSLNPELTYAEQGYSGYYSQSTYDTNDVEPQETPEQFLVDNKYPVDGDVIYDYCVEYVVVSVYVEYENDELSGYATLNANQTYAQNGYAGFYSQPTYDPQLGQSPEQFLVDDKHPAEGDTIYNYCNASNGPSND